MIFMSPIEYIKEMYNLDLVGLQKKTGISEKEAIALYEGNKIPESVADKLETLGRTKESWVKMDEAYQKIKDEIKKKLSEINPLSETWTKEQLDAAYECSNYVIGMIEKT